MLYSGQVTCDNGGMDLTLEERTELESIISVGYDGSLSARAQMVLWSGDGCTAGALTGAGPWSSHPGGCRPCPGLERARRSRRLAAGRPATAVTDLSSGEWAQLHVELKDLVPALGRLFSLDQVNLAFLMNQDAQVHLHVIPRYRFPRTWAGLVFTDAHWGSAFGPEQRPLPRELLVQLAAEIRAELGGSG
jgi:diadenosine tetraphosphate (Ap4A) HIT family hydrolase